MYRKWRGRVSRFVHATSTWQATPTVSCIISPSEREWEMWIFPLRSIQNNKPRSIWLSTRFTYINQHQKSRSINCGFPHFFPKLGMARPAITDHWHISLHITGNSCILVRKVVHSAGWNDVGLSMCFFPFRLSADANRLVTPYVPVVYSVITRQIPTV